MSNTKIFIISIVSTEYLKNLHLVAENGHKQKSYQLRRYLFMKSLGQPWCIYPRNSTNGILYVQFKDKQTGQYMTAKSTGTRDRQKAEQMAHEAYYNKESTFNKKQRQIDLQYLASLLNNRLLAKEEIIQTLKTEVSELLKTVVPQNTSKATLCTGESPLNASARLPLLMAKNVKKQPPELQELFDTLETLTFKDYMMQFWNYEKSPQIKQKRRLGLKIPNPERFRKIRGFMKKYTALFPATRLIDITEDEINTLLGDIKAQGKLKDSSMNIICSAFSQALHFAHDNRCILFDVAKGLTKFSKKTEEKEIFTGEELTRLFDGADNPFGSEEYQLLNEALLKTGCRIGELLALQIKDIERIKGKYALSINKSYCREGKRIKSTKTERCDFVPITEAFAAKLMAFVEKSPFKDNRESFVFYSEHENAVLDYDRFYRNFNNTLNKLGIHRKGLTLHSYRHTFATILLDKGFSQTELLYITRHDNSAELQRYGGHMTPEKEHKKRLAAAIMDEII